MINQAEPADGSRPTGSFMTSHAGFSLSKTNVVNLTWPRICPRSALIVCLGEFLQGCERIKYLPSRSHEFNMDAAETKAGIRRATAGIRRRRRPRRRRPTSEPLLQRRACHLPVARVREARRASSRVCFCLKFRLLAECSGSDR